MFFSVNKFAQKPSLGVVLILLTGIIIYANTFNVPFFLDDHPEIINNDVIHNLDEFLTGGDAFSTEKRYVAQFTLALNYHFGGLDVTGYHVINLIIHLGSALLVYLLLRLTLRTPYFNARGKSDFAGGQENFKLDFFLTWIPLLSALLFVVHPVQTQAVTYIVQRMTSLATLFCLLSVVLYVKGRLVIGSPGFMNQDPGDRTSQTASKRFLKPGLLIAGSVLSAILAMKSKEIAFTLPLAIALYEVFFFRGDWLPRMLFLLPLFATLPIVPLQFLIDSGDVDEAMAASLDQLRVGTDLSRFDYLFTQFRVIVTYLRLLVFPIRQNFDYDYPTYTSFFAPPVFSSFLLLTALILLALYLFRKSGYSRMSQDMEQAGTGKIQGGSHSDLELAYQRSEHRPTHSHPFYSPVFFRLISFGIFWFFLTLSVESSLIPIRDVIVEHRLYLPGIGAAVTFATVTCFLIGRFAGRAAGKTLIAITVILTVALGIATWQRNYIWGDTIRLWQDVVEKSPNKARPYNNLAVALENSGRRQEAIKVLSRAITVDPTFYHSYYNLGDFYLVSGQPDAALPLLQTAIRLNPSFKEAYVGIGAALMRSGRFSDVIIFLEQNLDRVTGNAEAHFYLGASYAFQGDRDAALRELAIVSRLDPALASTLRGMIR